jgi:GDPmannose 4,6-dehydratase
MKTQTQKGNFYMTKKRALITGITGMDGSHLADFLLSKDYEVYGLERQKSNKNLENIQHILDKITLISGDLSDAGSLLEALRISNPDEVYNLGAQSFAGISWTMQEQTANITGLGPMRLLEAIHRFNKDIRFLQASTSEMFGKLAVHSFNENTEFHPRNPYGVAKVFGHLITQNFRESYDMFACATIAGNHESWRRSINFVTQKIATAAARIAQGKQDFLYLGALEPKRDWGWAPEYVEAMWLILQQDAPDDYVLATGEAHSIEDFVRVSFETAGLDWTKYVKHDPAFMRPIEVDYLHGDADKIKQALGWESHIKFSEIARKMTNYNLGKGIE